MGDGKSREQTVKEPDRLAKAIAKKVEAVTIDEQELKVRRWNLHTSLELMGTLSDILKQMIGSIGPEMDIASLLQGDIGELLAQHEGNIVKILAGTLFVGNFETLEEAESWVKDLGAADALKLFAIIAKQNIRPLVEAVGEVAKELREKVNAVAAQKVSQRRTS